MKNGYPTRNSEVVKAVIAAMPEIKTLELICGNGYYYFVGEFQNGEYIMTSGIYVCSLGHLEFSKWVDASIEVINSSKV